VSTRATAVPPRQQIKHEDDAIDHAELCIRVMERFLSAVDDHPTLGKMPIDIDLFALYSDVLQEELEPYAFDLAYHLFSGSEVLRKWRREKDRQ
jgi:hypothetical protein